MTEHLEMELEPDPGWFEVPEEGADLEEWSLDLVRRLAGPENDPEAIGASAAVVAEHARAAHDLLVELAFVFLPEPLAPVVATCHIELVFGPAGDMPDPPEVHRSLALRRDDHLEDPEVGERLLQAGRSVRQHVLVTEEDRVTERVTHVVFVPELEDALVRITTWWRALALGDALVEQADRMAAALVLRTS
ncbi:hypothetical protein [Blastococcus haudaquaticus]|uniref:Uncharacterized protein n=1 Tax=Blastococcus haudaquaticus TaxID=1938745 RepID=A0A286H149_9ACTN|nr:hypothetical protein [Blastococcus haudaquaticus]SOE01471.1 hypothetical protein SAMN06272739_3181 [Blastococcus haudaquaticus]